MPRRRLSAAGRRAITPGPPNEAGQTVGFAVSNSDPALFALGGQPAVTAGGTLTFTPAPGTHGVATITVRAVDDGGTAGGGIDTSAPQAVTITVVNQSPVANIDSPGVLENDPAGVTFNVLGNDTDPEADSLSVASYDDSTIAQRQPDQQRRRQLHLRAGDALRGHATRSRTPPRTATATRPRQS